MKPATDGLPSTGRSTKRWLLGILVANYDGHSGDFDRDAERFAFHVATAPGARPQRLIVLVDRLFARFATPEHLGVPAEVGGEAALTHMCVAAIGNVLDSSGAGPLETGQPPVIQCFSGDIADLKSRLRAADEEILRYMAAKLYWGWKFDCPESDATYPDFWRLGVGIETLKRVMTIGSDRYWKQTLQTPHSITYAPLPELLRAFPTGSLPGVLTPATPSLIETLNIPRYAGPRANLLKSEQYLAPGTNDFENAVKEAICAVEGVARIVTGQPSQTLGDLIKELRSKGKLDGAIAKSFEGLWVSRALHRASVTAPGRLPKRKPGCASTWRKPP